MAALPEPRSKAIPAASRPAAAQEPAWQMIVGVQPDGDQSNGGQVIDVTLLVAP